MVIELLTKRYPGMRAWLMQRLTGLVMAIFSIVIFARVLSLKPANYLAWQEFLAPWWLRVLALLFWVSLTIHAWLGIRDVLKDYVPHQPTRAVMLKVVIVLLWVYLAWASWLLLRF